MKWRNPIDAGPDQRYWRSRGNRRVRKKRVLRQVLRWSGILAANAVIAAILLHAGATVARNVVGSDEFALSRVRLDGVERTPLGRLEARLARHRGTNLFDLPLHRIEADLRRESWIRNVSIRRVLPDSLRVTVEERTPIALAILGRRSYLVDETGYVIGTSGPEAADSLPVLIGLDGLDRDALPAALRRGVGYVDRLNRAHPGFAGGISELDLSRDDRVVVRTIEPGPPIFLDPTRIDRNVPQFVRLRDQIAHRVGAARYVDLRWRDQIAVMPAAPATQERNG